MLQLPLISLTCLLTRGVQLVKKQWDMPFLWMMVTIPLQYPKEEEGS